MREQQLSDHHRAVRLDLGPAQVQVLKARALAERLRQILSALTLDLVALHVQAEEAVGAAQQVTQGAGARVCYFVISQVNIFNVGGVGLEGRAESDQALVGQT